MATSFVVDEALAGIVRLAALWWAGADVTLRPDGFDADLRSVVDAARTSAPPDTEVVRAMYRRVGLDPTKTRPSSEALLRRVRRGDAFPRVNGLVDAVNVCSLAFQLPYGVYDRAALTGTITARLGRDEEAYDGIRKDTVHVAGRITLADDHGAFGNPTSDSKRSMITTDTRDALVVVYAPAVTPVARLTDVLDRTAARVAGAVGGQEDARWIA